MKNTPLLLACVGALTLLSSCSAKTPDSTQISVSTAKTQKSEEQKNQEIYIEKIARATLNARHGIIASVGQMKKSTRFNSDENLITGYIAQNLDIYGKNLKSVNPVPLKFKKADSLLSSCGDYLIMSAEDLQEYVDYGNLCDEKGGFNKEKSDGLENKFLFKIAKNNAMLSEGEDEVSRVLNESSKTYTN